MVSAMETIGDVMTGRAELKELKKQMEKALIKSVYAPVIKSRRREIVSKYDDLIAEAVGDGKVATETIVAQLDTAIRGKGRKAVEAAIQQHQSAYDDV